MDEQSEKIAAFEEMAEDWGSTSMEYEEEIQRLEGIVIQQCQKMDEIQVGVAGTVRLNESLQVHTVLLFFFFFLFCMCVSK